MFSIKGGDYLTFPKILVSTSQEKVAVTAMVLLLMPLALSLKTQGARHGAKFPFKLKWLPAGGFFRPSSLPPPQLMTCPLKSAGENGSLHP